MLKLKGLKHPVEVLFDQVGVPHIYGQNEADTYFALGYVHAQDRLFQMEMMRRVSAGRLSEIFGSSMIEVDKFFRMLGIPEHASESAKKFLNDNQAPYQQAALAYLAGINSFIENGATPVEFLLTGIPKEKFTATDMYLVVDYMSFVFQMAFKTDPLMSKIEKKSGKNYLQDIATGYVPGTLKVPVSSGESLNSESVKIQNVAFTFQNLEDQLPVPLWIGSNAWAVSPQKSKSGKVLFENDTHIGYGQPAVWYEAHLECPGMSFYGNFLAGFPFAPLGHTPELAWGLTIFENDDLDFFREKTDTQHPGSVWFVDHWEEMQTTRAEIKIKDSASVSLLLRRSHHGPICSDVIKDFKDVTDDPVAASWTFLKFPTNLFQVCYQLDHSTGMDDTRNAVSQITAPGLNVIYGDAKGNIAWWTAAKLVKRPSQVDSKLILDGANGKDEWMGWVDFKDNPHSENPSCGYVYSANNQPDTVDGILYPGYYTPEDRALRITHALSENKKFDAEDMQNLNGDIISDVEAGVAKTIMQVIGAEEKNKSENHKRAVQVLSSWNGDHRLTDIAPVIYYKLVYHILFNAMEDELGEKDFNQLLLTHELKKTIPVLLANNGSVWWDNSATKDQVETRQQIFETAFDTTIGELEKQLGKNMKEWKWGKVHLLEHLHPLGKIKPLNKLFNVGPFPIEGGNETVNQQGFELNKEGIYKIKFGPAIRRVIDFIDPENGQSILPTGQSGNFMSKHYSDQAQLFINGATRKEMMNRKEIEEKCTDKLTLQPK
jgi:penicillin amidase